MFRFNLIGTWSSVARQAGAYPVRSRLVVIVVAGLGLSSLGLAGCAGPGLLALQGPPSAERPGTQITLKNPDATKWQAVVPPGPRRPGASVWACRPLSCPGRAVLAAQSLRSPTRDPDPKALETASKLLAAQTRAQDVMLEAASDGENRVTALSNKVTQVRGYPAIMAESKQVTGKKTSYLVRGELFIGLFMVKVMSLSTDRGDANRNFEALVAAMEILDVPPGAPADEAAPPPVAFETGTASPVGRPRFFKAFSGEVGIGSLATGAQPRRAMNLPPIRGDLSFRRLAVIRRAGSHWSGPCPWHWPWSPSTRSSSSMRHGAADSARGPMSSSASRCSARSPISWSSWCRPGSPASRARTARRRIRRALDPERRYRALAQQIAVADTICHRATLAEECRNLGLFEEARRHYDDILARPHGAEPMFMLGKAQAEFGLARFADAVATLDALKARWPHYELGEGHLLYACALEESGRTEEALEEYDALARYYSGAEPRVRRALLLKKLGRSRDADASLTSVLTEFAHAPKFVRKAQAEWIALAEQALRG